MTNISGVLRRGPQRSPSIVFLHGGVLNKHMWEPVIDELESDFDCVAVDLPGHGIHRNRPFAVMTSVSSVVSAMDELSINSATFVGLSLGGYIAQAIAADHAARVKGLVLSGATIRYTGWDGLTTKLYGYLFPLFARKAAKAFASKLTSDFGEDLAGKIVRGGLSVSGGGAALRKLPGHDYAADLQDFEGPVFLVNGERDQANRDAESLFKAHVPSAVTVVIEDAGHACALQQPKSFATAVSRAVQLVG